MEPHREVAPQFYPSLVELKDGTTFTGILLRSSSTEVFRDLTGKEKSFPQTDIVKRTELKTSLLKPVRPEILKTLDGSLKTYALLLGHGRSLLLKAKSLPVSITETDDGAEVYLFAPGTATEELVKVDEALFDYWIGKARQAEAGGKFEASAQACDEAIEVTHDNAIRVSADSPP